MSDAASMNDFFRRLKKLMAELAGLRPNDAAIARTQKRLVLACDMAPAQTLEWTGEALFRYQESIYSDDPAKWGRFFTPGDTSVFADALGTSNQADRGDAEKIIYEVQVLASAMTPEKQLGYIETVRILLDYYLEYRAAQLA